ncbi:MAG: hypothetical protein ACRYGK_03630 [Janthinobacterium lividum]
MVKDAHEALEHLDVMSLPQLLGTQLKLSATSLQIEVISKGASLAVRHLDQLTKLQ